MVVVHGDVDGMVMVDLGDCVAMADLGFGDGCWGDCELLQRWFMWCWRWLLG